MAADLPINEELIIHAPETTAMALGPTSQAPEITGRVLHVYGERVKIVEAPQGAPAVTAAHPSLQAAVPQGLTETENFGVQAFRLRNSAEFTQAKAGRPRQGQPWNLPPGGCGAVNTPTLHGAAAAAAAAAPPTSAFLEGSVAVGIVIISGPTAALQFSAAEQTKVVAEVQNGLTFLANAYAAAGVSFTYDIRPVNITAPANASASDLEAVFRDPAMRALGFAASWDGVGAYVEDLRRRFGTRWTYCGLFTKYPVGHFAYASIGGPRIVMQYSNDGWGPDNIDRVFAHESGHIFGCPDEYASSGCDCAGSWGRWGKPNVNCENCAPGGGIACLMKVNDWTFCPMTPAHLGWTPLRFFAEHSNRVLDVSGGSTASGAHLIQWDYLNGDNQQIRPDAVGGGFFRLVVQKTGKVLDVSGASTANGAPIIQWDWHGGDNQLFRLEPQADGRVRIVAKHSGKVLDVTGASTANGAGIIQWDWHGTPNQLFLATAPVIAKHSGRAWDVSGASTANGAHVIQWDVHGGGNQIFRPEAVGGGFYRFVAHHSGRVLDVSGASTAKGAPLIQWDWHNGDNQKFRLDPLGDGHVRVIAKHSNLALDITGASTDNGAALIQWDWHGGPNQRFIVPRL